MKQKKYNFELREKRIKETWAAHDFPMKIRIKPTAHKQYCYKCRRLINKGSFQIMMESGVWLKSKGNSTIKSISMGKNIVFNRYNPGRVFPRNIYFHNDCFSCFLKKFFASAGISLIADCDTCRERFNCYTNNTEDEHWVTYIPSRPCSTFEEVTGVIE